MRRTTPRSHRVFRFLVRLLPFDLRFDHGREIEQVFREQHRDARAEGGKARAASVWLGAVRDILLTAPREHLADVRRDVGYAARGLGRNPGFTSVAILTLALGIGANTALFSVVDGVLLRPSPVPGLDRLVMLWETDRRTGTIREPASIPDYLDYAGRATSVDTVAGFAGTEVNLALRGVEPVRVATLAVSHTFLPLFGVRPVVGRLFTAAEDRRGGPRVALISESLWERAFGRDPGLVGRSIALDEIPHTIVGVLPDVADFGVAQILAAGAYSRSFTDRTARVKVEAWTPLQPDPAASPRSMHGVFLVGRLRPGIGVAPAQQEIARIGADLERAYPDNAARGAFVESLGEVVFGRARTTLWMLMGAVALAFLVAAVNVANLLLARGATRAREIAIRTALGAGGWRLARQLLIENLVLAVLAGAIGIGLALAGLPLLLSIAPSDVPRLATVHVDWRVLWVTFAMSVATGLAFGLLPVARHADIQAGLSGAGARQTEGRRAGRTRATLAVAEVALAVTLVVGACLLARSFWNLQQVDPGFRAAGVIKAEYQLSAARYPVSFKVWPRLKEIHAFNAELLRRASVLPGVEAAAIAGNHPLDPGFTSSFSVEGREAEARTWPEISIRRVTPSYFRTVGVTVVSGRLLEPSDTTDASPVLVVNQAAARRFFPGRAAEGSRIRLWGASRTIVGVVANERFHGLSETPPLAVYLPLAQAPSTNGAHVLLVRTSGEPTLLAAPLRRAIRDTDPSIAAFGVEPLQQTLVRSVGERRFTMVLLGLLGVTALLLAAIGVHGVLAYGVAQRTREIGIRMALGALPAGLRHRIIREGLAMAAVGLGIGLSGAYLLARLLRGLLFDVAPGDPVTFAAVAGFVALVAVAASYLPARRATTVDPLVALRAE